MTQGKFVVFEGPDFSGKDTLANHFIERVVAKGIPVKKFRTIGEGAYGQMLRDVLVDTRRTNTIALSEALLFLSAITDCYYNHVLPWINTGGVAVMDRYAWSTYVYQDLRVAQQAVNIPTTMPETMRLLDIFSKIKSVIRTLPIADVLVVMDIKKENAIRNAQLRDGGGNMNALDSFCINNYSDISQGYRDVVEYVRSSTGKEKSVVVIDNNPPYLDGNLDAKVDTILSALF